jgi:hypothetical protein
MDSIKAKNFYSLEDTIAKMKRQVTSGRKYLQSIRLCPPLVKLAHESYSTIALPFIVNT